jgi:hypothetical protein
VPGLANINPQEGHIILKDSSDGRTCVYMFRKGWGGGVFNRTPLFTNRLFADDFIIYRKIINDDMEKLQIDLDRLGEWVLENSIKINPSKSKAFRFTRARVKDPLNYSLTDTLIPEASSFKYLGIILRSDISWADQVNYTVKMAWKALHFTMRILKKGYSNTKV